MQSIRKRILLISAAVGALTIAAIPFITISNGEENMGLFKGEKVCLFSGFEGRLTLKGEPAAGAEVTRVYEWKNAEHRETVTTDAEGKFSFDSVWDTQKGFVVQFVSDQEINVNYGGQEYLIWTGAKLGEPEYWEFGGSRPKNLRCELTDEIRRVDLNPGFVGSSCHWEN